MIIQLVKDIHEISGHPGIYKTHHMLAEACTFRNMNREIAKILRECDACQSTKSLNYSNIGPSSSHKPKNALEKI